jgi:hypothetical protein
VVLLTVNEVSALLENGKAIIELPTKAAKVREAIFIVFDFRICMRFCVLSMAIERY